MSVNGRSAGDDCVATRALDVRPLLRDGANHVEMEIATTLGNRLIGLGKAGEEAYARFAKRSPRPAGLIGPVSLSGIAATT